MKTYASLFKKSVKTQLTVSLVFIKTTGILFFVQAIFTNAHAHLLYRVCPDVLGLVELFSGDGWHLSSRI
jgi:hypothetical protein